MMWLSSLVLLFAVFLVLTGLALMIHGGFRSLRMSRAGDRSDRT